MKNYLSRTLLTLLALMLINSYNTTCCASPFDDGESFSIKDKISDGIDAVKDTLGKGVEKVKSGVTTAKKAVTSGYKSLAGKINSKFNDDGSSAYKTDSIFLPGHESKEMVCQGIAYLSSEDGMNRYVLLSYYPKKSDQPSQLIVVDRGSGYAIRRFDLYKSGSTPYTGHAGGIAVAGNYVWVASGYKIYSFPKQEILDFIKDGSATAQPKDGLPDSFDILPAKTLECYCTYSVDSKASYISFDGKYLWVGDFTRKLSSYKPVPHHEILSCNGWVAGYLVDDNGIPTSNQEYNIIDDSKDKRNVHIPDAVIAIPGSVQGMAICGDYAAVTRSYGFTNSDLIFFKNPLNRNSKEIKIKLGDKKYNIKGWKLEDKKCKVKELTIAAGAEDLEYDGNNLFVTFECNSKNYRDSWISKHPTIKMTEDFYLIDINKAIKK